MGLCMLAYIRILEGSLEMIYARIGLYRVLVLERLCCGKLGLESVL